MGPHREVHDAVVQLLSASRAFTQAYSRWQHEGGPSEAAGADLREAAERLDAARRLVGEVQRTPP